MRTVTFLVLEGVDKGRVYKDLPIPVTIGRDWVLFVVVLTRNSAPTGPVTVNVRA